MSVWSRDLVAENRNIKVGWKGGKGVVEDRWMTNFFCSWSVPRSRLARAIQTYSFMLIVVSPCEPCDTNASKRWLLFLPYDCKRLSTMKKVIFSSLSDWRDVWWQSRHWCGCCCCCKFAIGYGIQMVCSICSDVGRIVCGRAVTIGGLKVEGSMLCHRGK